MRNLRRGILGGLLGALLVLGAALSAFAGDKKDEKKKDENAACDISFVVVKDYNGKPVKNASVIMHAVDEDGQQKKGGFQVKTDSEGKTVAPAMPYGKLRVQVIAQGFQTYGEDYEINEPQKEITIKMKRPSEQYSIYK